MSLRPIVLAAAFALSSSVAAEKPIALYTFEDPASPAILDTSGVSIAVDLFTDKPEGLKRTPGQLEFVDDTIVRSAKPSLKVTKAIKGSGEFSVEVLMRPADVEQAGPARIVTISRTSTDRNFTLGQDGNKIDARLRTTRTSENGLPSLATRPGSLKADWTHCVYSVRRGGEATIYLNGEVAAEKKIGGDLSNWNGLCEVAFGNEITGDRLWRGALKRVAIYDRALRPEEVKAMTTGLVATSVKPPSPPKPEAVVAGDGGQRVGGSLLALYDFIDVEGDRIRDRSGQKPPLDLKIGNRSAVRRSAGELQLRGSAKIVSEQPANRIRDAVRRSGALTIEAWVRPSKPSQEGPARVLTLSGNTSERNFTLGQDIDKWDVRLRTTKTDGNGNPSLSSKGKASTAKWTHVVYTRDRGGRTRVYLDGRENASGKTPGDFGNWQGGWRLALGDEHGGERRTWLGGYRLVAIYGRALSGSEVTQNFKAGPGASTGDAPEMADVGEGHPNAERFHSEVAPILSKHCLECHDTATQEGDLDLSKRTPALASKVLVPGKSGESELYLSVAEGEMPHKRDPLSEADQAVLKGWIDAGAHWPVEEIDPLAHKRDRRAAQNWVRRLTVPEYIATMKATVGVDVSKEVLEMLPRDLRADGFSNTAYNLGVDLKHIESYSRLAEIAVSRLDAAEFAKRFSRNRQFTDKGMKDLLEKMGRWVLRGPLEEHEVIAYRGISTAVASAGGKFEEAVSLMLEAMLQSPRFIYQIETQVGDGGRVWLDNYELASRMSYMIWGASPDRELAAAADKGELADTAEAKRQVERMMQDRRAIGRSLEFAGDWLDLGRLDNLSPNPDKFPNWKPELAADMREETLAFFREIIWEQGRPLHALMNAQQSFVSPRLALHYHFANGNEKWWQPPAPPKAESPGQLVKLDLSDVPSRGGLLTQGSVLTIGGDNASMVTRGLFVLHDLLRSGVNDPPPGTDTTPVASKPGLSQRMIAEQRVDDKACGGCHSKFEPLAYGLERYDGLGTYSEIDRYGNRLRADGTILFPGEAKPTPYQSSAELMDLLAESDRVRETLTWKVVQFALGRPLTSADANAVGAVHQAASKAGGTYQDILASLVMSELVQTTKTEVD